MRKCIICGENKAESAFNKEHIVPESLGGKGEENMYHHVCTVCNSKLGNSADISACYHLVFFRHYFRLPGKDKKVPNPYQVLKKDDYFPLEIKGQEGKVIPVKGTILMDQNGTITGFRAKPGTYDIGDRKLIVSEKKHFTGFVNNQLEKLGQSRLPEGTIPKTLPVMKKYPHIEFYGFPQKLLNAIAFRCYPCALKIAYEYFCKITHEHYFDDPIAKNISAELYRTVKTKQFDLGVTEAECDPYSDAFDEAEWKTWAALPDHHITVSLCADEQRGTVTATVDFSIFWYTAFICPIRQRNIRNCRQNYTFRSKNRIHGRRNSKQEYLMKEIIMHPVGYVRNAVQEKKDAA